MNLNVNFLISIIYESLREYDGEFTKSLQKQKEEKIDGVESEVVQSDDSYSEKGKKIKKQKQKTKNINYNINNDNNHNEQQSQINNRISNQDKINLEFKEQLLLKISEFATVNDTSEKQILTNVLENIDEGDINKTYIYLRYFILNLWKFSTNKYKSISCFDDSKDQECSLHKFKFENNLNYSLRTWNTYHDTTLLNQLGIIKSMQQVLDNQITLQQNYDFDVQECEAFLLTYLILTGNNFICDTSDVSRVGIPNVQYYEKILWPSKKNRQADEKVIAYARDVYDCSKLPLNVKNSIINLICSNDQLVAIVMWLELNYDLGMDLDICLTFIQLLLYKTETVKRLSDVIKALGLQSNKFLRNFCEMTCLLGRGYGDIDLAKDIQHRIGGNVNKNEVQFDEESLRFAIKQILMSELVKFDVDTDIYKHLTTSSLWTKKGGSFHPNYPKEENRLTFTLKHQMKEVFDRNNTGQVHIKPLVKYETGKNRYIYNCDTLSYIVFDLILDQVENYWKNDSVLLDPSKLNINELQNINTKYMYNDLYTNNQLWTMLDYSDFNSQHSIRNMQILFDELFKYLKIEDTEYARWILDSFNNMYLYIDETTILGMSAAQVDSLSIDHIIQKGLGTFQQIQYDNFQQPWYKFKWSSTLPSGHRATTFINSILNKAYVYDQLKINTLKSYHTGDDSIIQGIINIEKLQKEHNIQMNYSKQSIGKYCEFLRMQFNNKAVVGYSCRRIGTFVSGNWLSEALKENIPTLTSFINSQNSISFRGKEKYGLFDCLSMTAHRRYQHLNGSLLYQITKLQNVGGLGIVNYKYPTHVIQCQQVQMIQNRSLHSLIYKRSKEILNLYQQQNIQNNTISLKDIQRKIRDRLETIDTKQRVQEYCFQMFVDTQWVNENELIQRQQLILKEREYNKVQYRSKVDRILLNNDTQQQTSNDIKILICLGDLAPDYCLNIVGDYRRITIVPNNKMYI